MTQVSLVRLIVSVPQYVKTKKIEILQDNFNGWREILTVLPIL